jgi:hypothetical protein
MQDLEKLEDQVSVSSQFDAGAIAASSDLVELQHILQTSSGHLDFDAQYLSSIISKDMKAIRLQTSCRAHMVCPIRAHYFS